MDLTSEEKTLWQRVGKGLSHQIFDRFERFEDAVDEALSGLVPEERGALRVLLERMLASGEDARELWQMSGAGVAFDNPKGARMGLMMLLEAVKAKG
ncbi:hypothetical protein [Sagittula salina]|uniref:Uncharacterized protein n=1 Tax=Sagittula salina TaxID=2820268 RepID=A0A940MR97_9RHOB|nr:hypothetical protein [Sagittula salina]MBP0483263.1 hypothetical protein [Sagittula salina]